MATRFYFNTGAAAGVNPPTPSVTDWGHVNTTYTDDGGSNHNAKLASTSKSSTAATARTYSPDGADHLVNANACVAQFVSDTLPAQNFAAQSVTGQFWCSEGHANNNLFITVKIYVINASTGALLGTLLAVDRTAASEFGTTAGNRQLTSITTSQYNATVDCRLVFEIGAGGTPGPATGGIQGHNSTISFDGNSATDLPAGNTGGAATNNPWIEFANNLGLYFTLAASPLSAGNPSLGAPDFQSPAPENYILDPSPLLVNSPTFGSANFTPRSVVARFSVTLDTANSDTGASIRNVITLSGIITDMVRVTFRSSSTAMTVPHAGIAISAGADDMTGAPTELTFGGAAGFAIGVNTFITSDWVPFSTTAGQEIVVSYDLDNANGGHHDAATVNSDDYGYTAPNWNTVTPPTPTFSNANNVMGVSKVETVTGGPISLNASPLAVASLILGAPALSENQGNHDTLSPAPLSASSLALGAPLLSIKYVLGQQSFSTASPSLGGPVFHSPPVSGNTPTLVQFVAFATNIYGNGENGNNYKFKPPNPLGAGNLLVLKISYPNGSSLTSIADTKNTWSTTPVASADGGAGNNVAAIFAHENSAAGDAEFTITFSAALAPFTLRFEEWNNIATSSAADGSHSATNVAGPNLAAGSFTPTTDNDANGGHLILGYFAQSTTYAANVLTNWVKGSGFTLLDADRGHTTSQNFFQATEYQIQETRAAVNAQMTATGAGGDTYNCVAVAFKIADAGTPKPAGMHVDRVYHFTSCVLPAAWHLQAPMYGNLRVATQTANGGTSITDSESNTWTLVGSEVAQLYYFKNASPNEDLVITLNNTAGVGGSLRLYDISGADANPYDGYVQNDQALDGLTTYSGPSGSPTYADGMAIAALQLGQGPGLAVTSPTGATWDLCTYTNETDTDMMENADGNAHLHYSSTASQTWNFSITNRPTNSGSCVVAFFKEAAGGGITLTASPLSASSLTLGAPLLSIKYVLGQQSFSTASPSLGTVTFTQKQVLIAAYGISSPTFSAPVFSQKHTLVAAPLGASNPALGGPAVSQRHTLTAAYGISSPTLGAPTLSTEGLDVLSPAPLSVSALTLGAPVLTQKQVLIASYSITSPSLGAPAIGQKHTLAASYGISSPTLGAPTLSTEGVDNLNAAPLTTVSPVLGPASLSIKYVLGQQSFSTSSPTIPKPAFFAASYLGIQNFTTGSPNLGNVVLKQNHKVVASYSINSPSLGPANLSIKYVFVATNFSTDHPVIPALSIAPVSYLGIQNFSTASPNLGTVSLSSNYPFVASPLAAGSPVLPALWIGLAGILQPAPFTVGAPLLGAPALAQRQALVASQLKAGNPSLGVETLAQCHALAAAPLSAGHAVLTAPAIGQNFHFTATPLSAGSPVLENPTFTEGNVWIAANLKVGQLGIGVATFNQNHKFTTPSLSAGLPIIAASAIHQDHKITAVPPTIASLLLGIPELASNIFAADLDVSSPQFGSPLLSQDHKLIATYQISSILLEAPVLETNVMQLRKRAKKVVGKFSFSSVIGRFSRGSAIGRD